MKFTKEQIIESIEDEFAVNINTESWRHGTREHYIIPFEDKFYRICVPVTYDDGIQIDGDIEGIEVKKIQVMVDKWVAV